MNMGFELSQNLEQHMGLEHRLELKTGLVQKMEANIEGIRLEIDGPPSDTLKKLIDRAIASTESEGVRVGLSALFENGKLTEHIAKYMEDIVVLTKPRIVKLVVDFVNEESDHGNFQEVLEGEDGKKTIGKSYKVFSQDMLLAYNDESGLQARIDQMEETARKLGDKVTDVFISEIYALKDAISVVRASRQEIDTLVNAVTYVLVKKNGEGVAEVSDFIKDSVILRKMTHVESDRLMNRFVRRCGLVGKKKSAEDVKEFFMNTIGEITLISMGIISQEMFVLQKRDVDLEMMKQLREDFAASGANLDKLMESYRLHNSGGFFWNRWKTLDKRPSHVTDEKIRKFLTQTVRFDGEKLMEDIGYEEMVATIRKINSGDYSSEDERKDDFHQLFVDTFSTDEFRDAIVSRLKTKWYKELEVFYD